MDVQPWPIAASMRPFTRPDTTTATDAPHRKAIASM